jgi:glycosyltransferase involved in cell wall biosynthesis
VYLNGRFLTQNLSGVQRYALEMTKALDGLIGQSPALRALDWQLVAPRGTEVPGFEHIGRRLVGSGPGHLWEQVVLPAAAAGGVLVNFGNSGPLVHRNSIVVIHDAAVFRTPENFSKRYALAHQTLSRALARRATIGTVSDFSRGELSQILGIPSDDIFVARNGYDHMAGIAPDDAIVQRLGLQERRYYLFVGSPTRNKNLPLAISALRKLARPDVKLVLVGSLSRTVFADGNNAFGDNVVLAGRASDGEVVSLYRQAAGLVFPSRYEGFGIPPLESMVNGCPVLASDIPPVREVCGDAAYYYGVDDADGLARLMGEFLDDPGMRAAALERFAGRLRHFSWRGNARDVADAILRAVPAPTGALAVGNR